MGSRKPFLLRINPDLYRELECWAQQEFRSVNAQIEYLLKDAVRRRGRTVADEPPSESPLNTGQIEADEDSSGQSRS
jgi:hypothetical protein